MLLYSRSTIQNGSEGILFFCVSSLPHEVPLFLLSTKTDVSGRTR